VTEQYEILVVGSGEAGKYLAWTMAKAGHHTALIERKLIGGSCPNIACLPSKNVVHSAKVASLAKRAHEFGLEGPPLTTSMKGVLHRKRKMVNELIEMHLERFKASGAELIMGNAQFIDERTVDVSLNGGGSRVLAAKRLFLNLGTHTSMPDVPGLAAANAMTHIEALDLDRVPGHLVVLGGGYVGLELAQAMRRFGSRVTVIERGSQLAGREDSDVGSALFELFRDEGIEVLLEARVQEVSGRSGAEIRITVDNPSGTQNIQATDLLLATGRTPNTQSIGLEKLGVELDSRGYVKVNDRLETTAQNVWALGDCAGSPQFTHAAYDDFRVVRDNLNGGNRSTRNRLVPSCMFTDPELARVGLNESDAKRLGVEYRLAKMPMAAVLRTRTISEPRGFIKMLIEAHSDLILGLTAFGAESSELLAAVQTAILGGLPYTVLRDGIFTHPTMAEGLVFLLANVTAKVAQHSAA
jgi:pyruvate/2-oxoglutarate dehydrogenase complex dihydrolipoamide dehydrogenase (E3) component